MILCDAELWPFDQIINLFYPYSHEKTMLKIWWQSSNGKLEFQVNCIKIDDFRWIWPFDLFTKLFLFSSPYSNILIIKLSWKFDYKISNCNKVTGRTHARTHTWLQNPAFHYVRDGLINFSPLPALFSMSIDFREKRCGGNSGLQTSWRGIRHNWHLFICHRNII